MIWFGSSAGVALANKYPEAKSVGRWVTSGMAGCGCLCHRIFRDARSRRLASRCAAEMNARFALIPLVHPGIGWPRDSDLQSRRLQSETHA